MAFDMARIVAGVAVFAVLHSAFASRKFKNAAARCFGERNRNGVYRLFYLVQSAVLFGMLVAYMWQIPNRPLYQVEGPSRWLMHAMQCVGVIWAFLSARQVGNGRILGVTSFRCWLGSGTVPAEPEAQGPALDAEALQRRAGPFAWSRHPLNFAPLPILWLWPTMGSSLMAFNAAATVYLVVGSLHEESRLRAEYGEIYFNYKSSGTAFFIPWPTHSFFTAINKLASGTETTDDNVSSES